MTLVDARRRPVRARLGRVRRRPSSSRSRTRARRRSPKSKLTGDAADRLDGDVRPPTASRRSPPSATGTITATITPSGEAVAGDYVVTFTREGRPRPAPTRHAQIRFTVETSPIWALVGIGIIVLILGGLFYVFRTYGRR